MIKKFRTLLKTDLPFVAVLILALLAVPRVIIHDLHLADLNSVPYKVLATVPFLIWLGVAILRKSRSPMKDFLVLGVVFGSLLAITHQLLWDSALTTATVNMSIDLDPSVEQAVLRTAAVISSLLTGVTVGGFFGFVAWVANQIRLKNKR